MCFPVYNWQVITFGCTCCFNHRVWFHEICSRHLSLSHGRNVWILIPFSSAPAARLVAGRVLAQLLRLQDHELVVDDDELDDQAGHDRHRDEAVEAGAETGLGTVGHFCLQIFCPNIKGLPFFPGSGALSRKYGLSGISDGCCSGGRRWSWHYQHDNTNSDIHSEIEMSNVCCFHNSYSWGNKFIIRIENALSHFKVCPLNPELKLTCAVFYNCTADIQFPKTERSIFCSQFFLFLTPTTSRCSAKCNTVEKWNLCFPPYWLRSCS